MSVSVSSNTPHCLPAPTNMHLSVLELTQALIACKSITPEDGGCQQLIAAQLEAVGFETHHLRFEDTDNLWAVHGDSGPVFCFAGHTDVVPPGDLTQWDSDPFQPEIRGEHLYGRGAADMKSGLAAMISAAVNFVTAQPDHSGRVAFLITSDEEGVATNGTQKVIEWLQQRNETIDYCIVGEASSVASLGDRVMVGRRGSLLGKLTVVGKQGHIAYPHLADNPIHHLAPALAALTTIEWDQGNAYFPPTSFQVSNLRAGEGADNVIPGTATAWFNFRYATESSADTLKTRVHDTLDALGFKYELEWRLSGEPFLTGEGELTRAVSAVIEKHTGSPPELSTAGGTSDARFISPIGAQVVELGPINATIHKINERVRVDDLPRLAKLYQDTLAALIQ